MDKNKMYEDNLENKYIEIQKIFKPGTIEYLKFNGYKFENNLHKFSLQSLYDEDYGVFEDILFYGLFDDDYSFLIEKKYTDKNGYSITIKYDLLNLMAEKGYFDIKYYIPIINSDKKNLNFINNNGNTWLYNSIQKYINKYDENTIVEIIKNSDIVLISTNKKKVNKFIRQILKLCYDNLLSCLLEKNSFDDYKDFMIQIIGNTNFKLNKFINSSDLLFNFIIKNTSGKIIVNHENYMFYLESLRKLISSNKITNKEEYEQNYKNIICSDYIYNYTINILGSIAVNYYIDRDTMLAKEILQKIDTEKLITHFTGFESEVIEHNLIKLYENISKGLYSNDYIPLIKNIILIKHNVEVKYKDIEDFKIKIKPIIPELLKVPPLNNIYMLLMLFEKAVEDNNQELCILLLKNNKLNNTYKFVKYTDLEKPNSIEMYNSIPANKQIILNLLSNNMDEVILYMIETSRIELYESYSNYYNNNIFNSSKLYNTFLELLFLNNKISLIKKITDNKNINNRFRKNIITKILFLSLYYNIDEMTYHIFENHLQYVTPEIFIISLEDKLNTKNDYVNNHQQKNNSNPYKNISGVKLLFDTKSDWLIDKFIEQYTTSLPHYIIDEEFNSLLTLMIKNNRTMRLEQVIKYIGKNIFYHIPMFVLNLYNISHKHQSNGLELYWACKKNLNTIAWFFVSNQLGNLNYIDSDGNTCLIIACENKMESVVYEMICHSHSTILTHKNNLGLGLLDYAKKNNLTKISDLINKKINSIPSQNQTKSSEPNSNPNSNPFTTNPFIGQNLKQSELLCLTNWINILTKKINLFFSHIFFLI
jgi:hypothetical protein